MNYYLNSAACAALLATTGWSAGQVDPGAGAGSISIDDVSRRVAADSRLYLDFVSIFLADDDVRVAPPLGGSRPWIGAAAASAALGDAYSNSTGAATQRSFAIDEATLGAAGAGGGLIIVAEGRVALSESTTPNFNWTSEATAASSCVVRFTLHAPHRYSLRTRLIAAPDERPIDPASIDPPDGIEVEGAVSVRLRRAPETRPSFPRDPFRETHALDGGPAVLDRHGDGVLAAGTYVLLAEADIANVRAAGNRSGRAEAAFGVLLDLLPIWSAGRGPARAAVIADTGWHLPAPPGGPCVESIEPAAGNGVEFDVVQRTQLVEATARAIVDGRIVRERIESAAPTGVLPFPVTVAATAPTAAPAYASAIADQRSTVFDSGVLRAAGGVTAASGRDAAIDPARDAEAAAESAYSICFTITKPMNLVLAGKLVAMPAPAPTAILGGARFELTRVDEQCVPIEVLIERAVGDRGSECLGLEMPLTLPAGSYGLTALAEITAAAGAAFGDASFRYDLELRRVPPEAPPADRPD